MFVSEPVSMVSVLVVTLSLAVIFAGVAFGLFFLALRLLGVSLEELEEFYAKDPGLYANFTTDFTFYM